MILEVTMTGEKEKSKCVYKICREPKVVCVCCVQVISSSGAPKVANTESIPVSQYVHVCVCVCVKKKLIYHRKPCCVNSKTLSLTHGHFNNKIKTEKNKKQKHCLASVRLTDNKSFFKMRHPN